MRRGRTGSSGSAAASTRPTGSWPATRSTRRFAARDRSEGPPSRTANLRSSGRLARTAPGCAGDARSAPTHGLAPAAASRLVDRHGTQASDVVALGRGGGPARAARARDSTTSRPRSPGRPGRSWRCRSTTCSPGGCGWSRSCRTAARRSCRGSPRSWAASWAGTRHDASRESGAVPRVRRTASTAFPER